MKNGERVPDVGVFECLQTRSANVRLAHSHYQTNHDGAFHQSLSMLGSRRKMFIDVYRMLIHAQEAEQRVIELSNGAAGPVAKCLARFQFSEMAAVTGSWQLTTIASYRRLVRPPRGLVRPAAGMQAGTTGTTRAAAQRSERVVLRLLIASQDGIKGGRRGGLGQHFLAVQTANLG
jgi:hypothetical protein